MENKINLAELLKDCPKGMELYSTIYGTVYFEGVRDTGNAVLIDVTTFCNTKVPFYPDGKFNTYYSDSEMTLFPSKNVRTWEGFQRPFKDGDIVTWKDRGSLVAFIYKERKDVAVVKHHFALYTGSLGIVTTGEISLVESEIVFATEEEKQKLFDAIKANGYKWNPETKTLEKLIEPKFNVGDRIRRKNSNEEYTIISINDNTYYYRLNEHCTGSLGIQLQDDYELVPNKFDITTLKPFDKVLVRDCNEDKWNIDFFGYYRDNGTYQCMTFTKNQCIPYDSNKELLGTTNDCDDYFKTW